MMRTRIPARPTRVPVRVPAPPRLAPALVATVVALLLAAPAALAVPTLDGQFDVTGVGSDNELVTGPDGNIWVTLESAANDIARITPNGTVTEFNPANVTSPVGLTVGPDGNLWVTQPNEVARIPVNDPNAAVKFPVAGITDPRGLTTGPDGNLWAASGDKVVRIPPADPTNASEAFQVINGGRGIALGGDGRLWVADFAGARVARVTTAGAATYFNVGGGPYGIAAGAGEQVAYSNAQTDPHTIGRIAPGASPLTVNTPNADPFGVAFGADEAYWIGQFAADNLGRLTPGGAFTTLVSFPTGAGPRQLTAGPANTLWVALDGTDRIARVSGVDPPAPPPPPPNGEPQTTITKGPKKKVTTKRRRAKRVKLRFTSSIAGSTFECSLKKKGKRNRVEKRWAKPGRCRSPITYKRLRPGRYAFSVSARAAGVSDPTPAKRRFRVVRVRR